MSEATSGLLSAENKTRISLRSSGLHLKEGGTFIRKLRFHRSQQEQIDENELAGHPTNDARGIPAVERLSY
jgi:hypothetical protein